LLGLFFFPFLFDCPLLFVHLHMFIQNFIDFGHGRIGIFTARAVEEIRLSSEERKDGIEERFDSTCGLSYIDVETIESFIVAKI